MGDLLKVDLGLSHLLCAAPATPCTCGPMESIKVTENSDLRKGKGGLSRFPDRQADRERGHD